MLLSFSCSLLFCQAKNWKLCFCFSWQGNFNALQRLFSLREFIFIFVCNQTCLLSAMLYGWKHVYAKLQTAAGQALKQPHGAMHWAERWCWAQDICQGPGSGANATLERGCVHLDHLTVHKGFLPSPASETLRVIFSVLVQSHGLCLTWSHSCFAGERESLTSHLTVPSLVKMCL